ncbi:BCCT family transporter [Haloarcula sp. GH36]|uniref:BCCT family transporter n=1 Tax=Haloarcula montana TaxID=3111776 RepID=UPI002D78137A|nr:BCCT family transporter [Haloarcula sp. GH36]
MAIRDSFDNFVAEMDRVVTGATLGTLLLFVVLWVLQTELLRETVIPGVRTTMLSTLGPVFLTLMVGFVLFALVIIVGPWGGIRLGGPDATPTYSYRAYFTMFFSAGIAAGIVFWAPSEVLFHYSSPPPFVDASAGSAAAGAGALRTVFFHWGISAWAAYVAIGLPIGYYAYNKGAPLRVSTLLLPFLGKENLSHPLAKLVDVLAVFATIGGLSTSVGLVSNQFLSGVEYQWGTQAASLDALLLVGGLTTVFTISVITGVKRGIRRIAGVNVVLFLAAGVLTLVVGPTAYILTEGSLALGSYLATFVQLSFAGLGGGSWFQSWTLFYWVWWFSWAPFAGLFLAAISRGRTLRTVAATGVFATSAATLMWFAIVSSTALRLQETGAADILSVVNDVGYNVAGFPLFGALPLGEILLFLFMALIVTWIVTSADTSTLSVAILATKPGVAPGTATRLFWGVLQGTVGLVIILLGASDGLQSAAVITGGPFGLIALVGILGLALEFFRTDTEGQSIAVGAFGEGDD